MPDCEQLDRMAQLFGRAALLPIVQGLRTELQGALATLRRGDMPDAHRLAGLTGILGFVAASAALQAVDLGTAHAPDATQAVDAALMAVEKWLGQDS